MRLHGTMSPSNIQHMCHSQRASAALASTHPVARHKSTVYLAHKLSDSYPHCATIDPFRATIDLFLATFSLLSPAPGASCPLQKP